MQYLPLFVLNRILRLAIIVYLLVYNPLFAQSIENDLLKKIILTYDNNLEPSKEDLAQADSICYAYQSHSTQNAQTAFLMGLYMAKQNTPNTHLIPFSSLKFTLHSSEYFEKSIVLDPAYIDQNFLIDAHTKLASIWGNLAIAYQLANKRDSAIWAWVEGKKRGAFDYFMLEYNKLLLDKCEIDATLLVDGDNFYYPLRYLQEVSSYRTDVKIIHIDLLNTFWYPNYLDIHIFNKNGLPVTFFDSATYKPWEEKQMTITNDQHISFEWDVKPTYLNKYILRADFLLLDYLQKVQFNTPINYIEGITDEMLVGLPQLAIKNGPIRSIANKNNPVENSLSLSQYLKQFTTVASKANLTLHAHQLMIDHVRFIVLKEVNAFVLLQQKELAKKLITSLNHYLPIKTYTPKDEQLILWQNQLNDAIR